MDYKMVVEIPVTDVPDFISSQEAKVTLALWLETKIPDAIVISLEEVKEERK